MKKLFILSFLLVTASVMISAQTKTLEKVFTASQTYYEFVPTSAQYIGGHKATDGTRGYDTLNFVIAVNKDQAVNCNARVEVSSRVGSADTYKFELAGKVFENGTYANIIAQSSKTASSELADTILVTDGPAYNYRYYRIQVNDDNACATTDSLILSKVIFKIYKR